MRPPRDGNASKRRKRLIGPLLALPLIMLFLNPFVAVATAAPNGALEFGLDAGSALNKDIGPDVQYGTMWIGPWTLTSGWGTPGKQLRQMEANGITPAVHFYYWGDDISPKCVKSGCWSSLHHTQKDQAGWNKLADQLTSNLKKEMKGKPVLILLETEFNKGGMEKDKGFDKQLADMVNRIKRAYPNAEIVLSLGNWGREHWPTWSQAAAASDYIGIQGMRGATRHTPTQYRSLYDDVLAGAETAKKVFKKPIVITDISLSSYTGTVSKVHLRVDDGAWMSMSKSSWGSWTRSTHIPDGSKVQFRATDSTGRVSHSPAFEWGGKMGATPVFDLASSVNPYWAEVYVVKSLPHHFRVHQAETLQTFFQGAPALKAAGVEILIYRSWTDSPKMNLANWFGQAERHWGLVDAKGNEKPAAKVWKDGVRLERR